MSTILLVTSSPRGTASYSNRVGTALAQKLIAAKPGSTLVTRDLVHAPAPQIDEAFLAALWAPEADRSADQKALVGQADALIAELIAADVVIVCAAMINFGIPIALKAWIDSVLRAGITFRYTDKGAEGLLSGKKVYIVSAKGGIYAEGPNKANNFLDPHLKALFAFIGLTDVETISIEGVAYGPEMAEKALAQALDQAEQLAGRIAA
jgi:FMN-dependent NADH-azoreductase